MSKRKILAACKRKGVSLVDAYYAWIPEPGESVPCWTLILTEESRALFGVDSMNIFDNVAAALEWIEELEPCVDTAPAMEGE